MPPKLIPRGLYGVSVWVTVLLDKYGFLRPTGRPVEDLATQGLELSAGTVTDGLRRLAPLFATLELWGINPRLWLTAYLEACAAHGGKPPPDALAFLPWNLSEARRRQFAGLPTPET